MNYLFFINEFWSIIEEVRNFGILVMGKYNFNFWKIELKIWGYRFFWVCDEIYEYLYLYNVFI